MSDHTPSLDRLKESYVLNQVSAADNLGIYTSQTTDEAKAEFDRAVERVKAEAWREGYCRGELDGLRENPKNPDTINPYRSHR